MKYRGKAWELLKPVTPRMVPDNWPFFSGYRLKKVDSERMHQLSEDLRAMYYALERWRDFAYGEATVIPGAVHGPHDSPNVSPDYALQAAKDVVGILENYRATRAYFWRQLRRQFPALKGQKVEIIISTEGSCYAVLKRDLNDLSKEGFGFLVSISRKKAA